MILRTKYLLLGVGLALVVAPSVANAKIVEGQSIGRVSLGQTKRQVKADFGGALPILRNRGPVQWSYLNHGAVNYMITFTCTNRQLADVYRCNGARVASVTLYDQSQKTSKGIGVGSTLTAVRRAYPGISKWHGVFVINSTAPNGDVIKTVFAPGTYNNGPHNKIYDVEIMDYTVLSQG
jgi:hypothetical protein